MTDDTNPITHNFKVLASLTDIFHQLAGRGALVGRLGTQIVIDASEAPTLFLDELKSIFQGCSLISETGGMCVFSSFTSDGNSQTILLEADTVLHQSFDDFIKFPALREIRRLIEILPPLPRKLADHYAVISGDCANTLSELLQEHGNVILQAFFSSSEDEADQPQDAPKRVLN